MLINALDGVTKTLNLENAVEGPYQLLGHDQNTVFIQPKELVEIISARRGTRVPRPTSVPLIPPQSASEINLLSKNTDGAPSGFHRILDQYIKNGSQLEF